MCSSILTDFAASFRRGFTLIELLVVIAIIAILAGLSFGAISKVRNKADSAASLSNLRQIGIGMSLYCAENNGKYPYDWNAPSNTTWRDLISRYIESDDSSPDSVFVSPTSMLEIDSSNTRSATYAVNSEMMWAYRQLGQDPFQPPVTTLQVNHPAQVILVADSGQSPPLGNSSQASFVAASGWWYWNPTPGAWLDDPIPVDAVDPSTGTEPGGAISYRDNGHAACLLADGHVQRFAKGEIKKRNLVFFH